MTKPTLLQTIFNQPSRTYLDPNEPVALPSALLYTASYRRPTSIAGTSSTSFYSATSASSSRKQKDRPISTSSSSTSFNQESRKACVISEPSGSTVERTYPRPKPAQSRRTTENSHTAPSSTRPSGHSSLAAVDKDSSFTPNQSDIDRSDNQLETLAPTLALYHQYDIPPDSDEEDVFYTPVSSPHGSPSQKTQPPPSDSSPSRDHKAHYFNQLPEDMSRISKTSATPNSAAKVPNTTISQPSHGNIGQRQLVTSMYSSTSSLPSTSSTSPPSESAFTDFSWRSPSARSDTSISTSIGKDSAGRAEGGQTQITARRRTSRRSDSSGSVSEDWAKDVRWLVDPEEMHKKGHNRSSSSAPSSSSSTSSSRRDRDGAGCMVQAEYDALERGAVLQRASSTGSVRPRRRPRAKTSERSNPADRMSAVLEVDENNDHHLVIGISSRRPRGGSDPAVRRSRTYSSHSSRSRQSRPGSMMSTASYQTVTLPSPLPVTDGSAPSATGYTSLVLPRAAYVPQAAKATEKIDLTLGGLAQTTMSTISITKHAAQTLTRTRSRRLSIPSVFFSGGKSKSEAPTPSRLLESGPSSLSFASNTPPPTKLQSGQVMVQVWAVAVDGLDRLIVHDKCQKPDGFGFVPGRSFVGRAIECGWDVTHVSKGDWVFGLLDVTKSGALSEFIAVDRRRVCCSPAVTNTLSLEQIAVLPLIGIPARRAVRTVPSTTPKRKALVLHAVSGSGALITQELTSLGVQVVAQVDPTQENGFHWATSNGASEVVVATPLKAMEQLQESSLDVVIDTVGGKAIWDSSRRLLRPHGSQFTTLVGDSENTVPSINAHVKSNMRSLRRAFTKKDKKNIGYEWVSPAADVDHEGEDVRGSLMAISRMAADGMLAPPSNLHILPFERTPEVFAPLPIDSKQMPGVSTFDLVVVRIVG